MAEKETLREILDRLDIVEVIGGYIPLKRSGQNWKAICPFHPEKTPSFVVYPHKQFYICYGCHAAGDVVGFVMKFERLDFWEAVEILAEKAGVSFVRWQAPSGSGEGKEMDALRRAHEWAAEFYHRMLNDPVEGMQARKYLAGRRLDPKTWETFRLGYAPNRWDGLLEEAHQSGISPRILEQAGLVVPKDGQDGWYDRFRNRVIFPIWDSRGRVIAFGGRILSETSDGPKYLNSPETDLYVKGKVLYGLHLTAPQIRAQDFCIVVEGYMDLVSCWQHGIRNVVASMGTSLTEAQVRLIRRHTRHVVMLYDADHAGQMATLRGLDLFVGADMRVKVAILPTGSDPDSLLREEGMEGLVSRLRASQELFDYKMGYLKDRYDPKSLEGRIRICEEMLPTIKRVPSAIQRSEYLRRLAEVLDVDEMVLRKEMERVRIGSVSERPTPWKPRDLDRIPDRRVNPPMEAEGLLIGLLLEDPKRIGLVKERLAVEDLDQPKAREWMGWLLQRDEAGTLPEDPKEVLLEVHRDSAGETQTDVFRWLAWADTIHRDEKEKVLEEVLWRIRRRRQEASLEDLKASLRRAEEMGDASTAHRLLIEINRILKTHSEEVVHHG